MFHTIKIYFILFLIYSFLGWCIETVGNLIQRHKFVNRGFLIGPYCPIYGGGALLITLLLKRFIDKPILLFVMAILLCGILEYITSFVMEKIFHLRWWDYSDKKININGRVCLNTIIPFGILGMIIIYWTNPFFMDKLNMLSSNNLNIAFYILFAIYTTDIIISLIILLRIKSTTTVVNRENREDNTEEITKKVREILLGKSFAQRRLVNAYPELKIVKIKIKEKIDKTKKEIENKKELIENKVNDTKNSIDEKTKNVEIKKKKE